MPRDHKLLREQGLCPTCGAQPESGITCNACKRRAGDRRDANRTLREGTGLCKRCGAAIATDDLARGCIWCERCRTRGH